MAFSKEDKGTLTLNIDAVPGIRQSIRSLYKAPTPQKVSWSYDSTEVLSILLGEGKQSPVQLTMGELIESYRIQAMVRFDRRILKVMSWFDMTEGLAGHTPRKIKRRPI